MKFYVSTAFLDTREVVDIARAADELGYDGMGIPDHVVNLETLETPYPYTKDGSRRWEPFTHWPDPWVMIGAIALATTRLRFVTTVYLPAMRDPYSAAKAIGTAACLADGRLELGIGVGWCEEEFTLMGQRFDRRGKRTDEMLELMRALWQPGWTEFDGEFYQTPRLEMEPTPPHIPIYVGGLSDIALRRAARNDGWIGDLITTDRAIASVAKLRELRAEKGLSMDDFTVLTPLTDAFTPEHYARAEAGGIDGIITMPWMFYSGPKASLADKIDGMKRFRKDLALDIALGAHGVERPGPTTDEHQQEEAEAVQHGELATVLDGPQRLRLVLREVGERHLARADERGQPGDQSDEEQHTDDQFDETSPPERPGAHRHGDVGESALPSRAGRPATRTASGWHGPSARARTRRGTGSARWARMT